MIFDTAIVQTWHLGMMLGMFVLTYTLLHALIAKKPVSWRVHATGKPIYYTGWILSCLITVVSIFLLQDINLAIGLFGSTLMCVLVGRVDEEKRFSPGRQFFWQVIIALWAVYWGWSVLHVTNPFGEGVLIIPGILGSIAAFFWFLLLMNTMNFLDGTDGLASEVAIITCIALAAISLLPSTQDVKTLLLSLASLGALAAFFLWNAPPARMYLGTAGSWFLGLFIGMIAIVGGGKVATVLIVLALPIIDALFVVIHRIASGKKPWIGDTKRHLHHFLHNKGINPWGILFIAGILTLALGTIGVIASTSIKMIVLAGAAILFFITRFRTMKV